MSGNNIEQTLSTLGITLPDPALPVAKYVPCVISGTTLYVSGQLPLQPDGEIVTGHLGADLDTAAGSMAARLCAVQIFAQAKKVLGGDLDRLARCIKLGGFVSCLPDFTEHPQVINGASSLMVEAMGEAGKHARFAVGVPSLPLGAAVEIDAMFEVRM